jgi:hypothetical protein
VGLGIIRYPYASDANFNIVVIDGADMQSVSIASIGGCKNSVSKGGLL